MLRGYLVGIVTGTVVSGAAVGTLSVLTDVPGEAAPEAAVVEVPAGTGFDPVREDEAASLPQLQETQTPDEVPQVVAPAPDDLSSLQGTDTGGLDAPQTGTAEGALSAPDVPQAGADVVVDRDEPVLPNPQALAPEAPGGEEELSISTEPAQPVAPEIEEDSAAFPPVEDSTEAATPDDGAEADIPAETEEASEPSEDAATSEADSPEPATDMAEPEAETTAELETAEPEAAEPEAAEPESAEAATAAPEGQTEAETATTPETAEPEVQAEADAGGIAEAPQQETEPQAEETVGDSTIGNLAPGVTTNRLPTAVTQEETAQAAEPEPAAPAEDTRPPLEKFAVAFENPENKPLMSIVLIDDGTSPIGPQALADFPYPISFAVDASRPDAADIAAKYRAFDMEVLAMADLPEGAAPTDAEVAMATYLNAVPEAVAVFEGLGAGLQAGLETSQQLAAILKDSGHGIVMLPNGLNTAQKLIAREGVPSATVFRDFDGKGQNASAVRRFLDQAAFRAGQEEGGVIMLGRLRPDTISALLLWGLQDRAASVALAPVSAVLQAQ